MANDARPHLPLRTSKLSVPFPQGVVFGLDPGPPIVPFPKSVDSPPSEILPPCFADFLLIGIWVYYFSCIAGPILLHRDNLSHPVQMAASPRRGNYFEKGLSPQFSVAVRWHIPLPLPPSQTELAASGSKANETDRLGRRLECRCLECHHVSRQPLLCKWQVVLRI